MEEDIIYDRVKEEKNQTEKKIIVAMNKTKKKNSKG